MPSPSQTKILNSILSEVQAIRTLLENKNGKALVPQDSLASIWHEPYLSKIKTVWEKAAKDILNISFEDYLKDIPPVPKWPKEYNIFDRKVLVDKRLVEKIELKKFCEKIGVKYYLEDDTFEPYDKSKEKTGIYWMRCQDGRKNRNKSPDNCRKEFKKLEVGMDAVEGLFTYLDDSKVIEGHYLDLPGSVHRGGREVREYYAYLGVIDDGPKLRWRWNGDANPKCGAASRGE